MQICFECVWHKTYQSMSSNGFRTWNDQNNCKVHKLSDKENIIFGKSSNHNFLKSLTLLVFLASELPINPYAIKYCGVDRVYKPECGNIVVGVITKATASHYCVDIEAAFEALLPLTSFNQCTKQNRPRLSAGSLVVARVVDCFNYRQRVQVNDHLNCEIVKSLEKFSQAKLSCVDLNDSHSWSSGKVYFGEISNGKEGYSFLIPISLAISLQADDCYILDRLGSLLPFEIAVGVNGRVWVQGGTVIGTLIVQQVLKKACGLSLPQIENLILAVQNCYANAKISPQI